MQKAQAFVIGVQRAVDLIEKEISKGTHICTLGPLIHNTQYVASLADKGVAVIDSIHENTQLKSVVIRSHGVPRHVYQEIEATGAPYIDATCPFVSRIHRLVEEFPNNGLILIIGDMNHPEIKGICGTLSFLVFWYCRAIREIDNLSYLFI